MTPLLKRLEFKEMCRKNILFLSLFIFVISSCGGGGGGAPAAAPQQNTTTPSPTPAPVPSPTSVTSNLVAQAKGCLLYTSPSPRDQRGSRMPSSA